MFQSAPNGKELQFQITDAGKNEGNFVLKDLQTRSWWQQVEGKAIAGNLKGSQLSPLPTENLPFGLWRQAHPDGQVAEPVPGVDYNKNNFLERIRDQVKNDLWYGRSPETEKILAVRGGKRWRAYPFERIQQQRVLHDTLDGQPVLLLARSQWLFGAFRRSVSGRTLTFMEEGELLRDAETGSRWRWDGHAIEGPLTGQKLERLIVLSSLKETWARFFADTDWYRSSP